MMLHCNRMEQNQPDRIRGRTLQRIRYRVLANNPLCVRCQAKGRITIATQVDHIIALVNGGSDDKHDDSNRQGLCDKCHWHKTSYDLGGRPAQTIGPDGWPISAPEYGSAESLSNPAGLRPSAIPLTILFGPPAAGKSTLGAKIASETGAYVLDLDNYFKRGARTLADAMHMRNADLMELANKKEGSCVLLVGSASSVERQWWRDTLKPAKTILVMCSLETSLKRAETRDAAKKARTLAGLNAWWAKYSPDDTEILRTD